MARLRNPIPSLERCVTMSTLTWTQIDLVLFSPLEGRVPLGAMKEFLERAVAHELERMKSENPSNS